jgi:hypothetical protein
MTNNEWNEDDTNTPYFKPQDEGDTLQGVVVAEAESQFDTKAFTVELTEDAEVPIGEDEVVEMEEGEEVNISYSVLEEFLEEHIGDEVMIEYEGDEVSDKSGMAYKTFERKWRPTED